MYEKPKNGEGGSGDMEGTGINGVEIYAGEWNQYFFFFQVDRTSPSRGIERFLTSIVALALSTCIFSYDPTPN